jgi:CRP-like cAMP-binding protein
MQYSEGSIIYFSGDKAEHAFVLQKGAVLLTGAEITTGAPVTEQITPGGFFGIKSCIGHFPREETATVLVDSVALMMTLEEFEGVFTGNKQLIIKMLQFFSAQLRTLHHKTETLLKSNVNMDQPTGMLDVAKSFYNEGQYKACGEVCNRLLARFPAAASVNEAKAVLQNAAARTTQETISQNPAAMPVFTGMGSFMAPAFDRFFKKFEPGELIIAEYDTGDTFYLLQSGSVQTVKCANGAKTNLGQLKPGDFFGEMSILENSPRTASCVALTAVEVLEFNKENFELLVTGNPQMAWILLKTFCKRIYDQQRSLRILCIADLSTRIADVFLMIDEKNTDSFPMNNSRSFPLTMQEVAHWAALPLEVVQSELSKLVEKHRLEIFDDHIVVNNITDFRRMVESQTFVRGH